MTWFPDNIPIISKTYNTNQSKKKYLTLENILRFHPGWTYDNKSYVDDDYLFYNEGWRLIIDEKPTQVDPYGNTRNINLISYELYYPNFYEISLENRKVCEENSIEDWIHTEKTAEITYSIFNLIDDYPYTVDEFEFNIQINKVSDWDKSEDGKIVSTYAITPKTEEQKDIFVSHIWQDIRHKRNNLLTKSDHYTIIAFENGKTLHSDFIQYRQSLRDFPNTITNLKEIYSKYLEERKTLDFWPSSVVDINKVLEYPQLPINIFF